MFCEYCGYKLNGEETECPKCHRGTGGIIQGEFFREGRGLRISAHREEELDPILRAHPAKPAPTAAPAPQKQETAPVQNRPARDHGPELEEMRSSVQKLSGDLDAARQQLRLSEKKNDKLKKNNLIGLILVLILGIALIITAILLIRSIRRKPDPEKEAVLTLTPTPEETPTPTPEETPTPTPEETPTPTPEETPTPAPEETPTPTPEETPTPTPEETPTPTPEETPTPTPEETPAPTPEETPAPTPEETPAPKPENTPVPTPEKPSGRVRKPVFTEILNNNPRL